MVGDAVRFIQRSDHVDEVNESSIQTLYWQVYCHLF